MRRGEPGGAVLSPRMRAGGWGGRVLTDERGQTFTEYIMISGFIVMVGLFAMKAFQLPFRQRLQDIASYVLNNAADMPW